MKITTREGSIATKTEIDCARIQAEKIFGDKEESIRGYIIGFCSDIPYPPSNERCFVEGFCKGKKDKKCISQS